MQLRKIPVFIAIVAGFAINSLCAEFPITVILVRHAEKSGTPPGDSGLSGIGQLRARTLDAMLANAGITAIYASEAARTQLTVKPLADRLHLEVKKFPADQPQGLAQAIVHGGDRVILVAGHSNRVPQIIQALGGGPVAAIEEASEFDNLYVVTICAPGRAATVRLHYGQPSSSTSSTLVAEGGEGMRITFGRSGGLVAAPGLAIEATLELGKIRARVTDRASGYVRDLSPEEAGEVRGMIDPESFFQLPNEMRSLNESVSKSGRVSVSDQRQYDIGVHLADGRQHNVATSEAMADEAEQRSHGLGKFMRWMSQEFDRIMSYRVSAH
jgi:phosphohistidine phosphatase SixA